MNDIVAIMRAAHFAALKHTKQKRKGGEEEPYLNHLIEVADLVAEATDGRPNAVIAALLHDVVEDQEVKIEEIADLFGPTVASIVDEVSTPEQNCIVFRSKNASIMPTRMASSMGFSWASGLGRIVGRRVSVVAA